MQHYFLKFNIVVHCSVAPVVSDSLQPHELQHARPPSLSLSLEVYWTSCSLHQWYHPAISSSGALLSFCPQLFSASFSNESAVHIRWPEYWNFSFSISPSNRDSGLISFKIDWFDLLAFQGIHRSHFQHHVVWRYQSFGTPTSLQSSAQQPCVTTGKTIA